ncbi:acyl carrier protein [Janibacter anophelis]|uniref:acyl carrier protein n=1 Tax=Janibacter anophelis TaxID=319054 RepID=UPI003F7F4E44
MSGLTEPASHILREMVDILKDDVPELSSLPLDEFATCSLRDKGVDSLGLTTLAVGLSTNLGVEISDEFLFSKLTDDPKGWVKAVEEARAKERPE